ncbi:hypothetical protein EBB79_05010 [Parasedimentitalea marina]|uniref:Uncharacterized protein n=1 Tax=Parasedimentitalea marina TaxID=2483033 RepID=A0A3T0MZY7_9RHOB|nr:hypothetical protein EBB79_05010 [Parasedimentitalea marina]
MIVAADHPTAGKIGTIGGPVKFNRAAVGVDLAVPLLEQHNRETLNEAGHDLAQIAALSVA